MIQKIKNPRIMVCCYPFCHTNNDAKILLKNTGWDIIFNPFQRIMTMEEKIFLGRDVEGIVVGSEDISEFVEKNKKLQFISRTGVGLDNIPFQTCHKRNIVVHYTPDAVTLGVAEAVIGTMIIACRFFSQANFNIRKGIWKRYVGYSIKESTIGLIGFGRIGKKVAQLLSSFQPASILVNDIADVSHSIREIKKNYGITIHNVSIEELCQNSDIVSLHIPMNQKNETFFDRSKFALLKKGAFFINFSRGGIVDEEELYKNLTHKKIQGAALDVFKKEPYQGKLCSLKNVFLTSHMGSCTQYNRHAMEYQACEAVVKYFRKEKLSNIVTENQ